MIASGGRLRTLLVTALAVGLVVSGLLLGRDRTPASPEAASSGAIQGTEGMPEAADAAGREDRGDQQEAPSAEVEAAEAAEAAVEPPAEAPGRTSEPSVARPKPAQRASLPPFQPGLSAPAGVQGPPPGVLWLAGVIGGDPRVALLRRGKSRFLVREGDSFEDRYRVVSITSNSVTLERGTRTQRLRVGEY